MLCCLPCIGSWTTYFRKGEGIVDMKKLLLVAALLLPAAWRAPKTTSTR